AGVPSKDAMMAQIAAYAGAARADAWIKGQGWNESRWGTTEFPVAADLDAVTGPEQPAIMWRSDMHGAVVNSVALRLAGITASTADPPGGVIDRDARGAPTGVLRETAILLVSEHVPPPSAAQLDDAFRQGMRTLHSYGITAIHDQRIKDVNDGRPLLASLRRLRERRELKLRVNANIAAHDLPHVEALGLRYGFGDDYLRLGFVKVFSDGSLGTRTAWMLAPFEKLRAGEGDNLGVNVTPPEQMADEFRRAVLAGFPISVHAIGDRANRVVLDIFEELADAGLRPPVPHRMEHVQIIDPADLPRLARLGITASVQLIHATDDMDTADLLVGARGANMYNFRTLRELGTLCAYGSDAPVADVNPFLGMHAGLTRQRVDRMDRASWYPDERISMAEIIHGYTKGPALAAGWDDIIGAIWPGMRADLAVLDRDLFELADRGVTGDEIAATQVAMTVFDGEIVHTM
ncbi:MAG: amidohydrolase, partial [Caldilineaceae bacterium]|nr:amidohydrolase [Caldilineaceae bacterium]